MCPHRIFVRVVRTGIELMVLAVGWMLGGTVGIGTVIYAVAIGPIVHVMLPLFTIKGVSKSGAEEEPCPQDACGEPGSSLARCGQANG